MACGILDQIWKSGRKGWKPFVIIVVFISVRLAATGQTVADTFDTGDIPTNLGAYSSTCNGPTTTLRITLPAGGPWNVTGADISYSMTALSGGFKSHQRSQVRCQNTGMLESTVYQGTGNTGGVQMYNRPGVGIANSNYPGGTTLVFEMRAWRTAVGSGCSSTNNRIDVFSWIITVHYSQISNEGSVGIGTTSPATSALVDLSSTTQAFLPPRMTSLQRDAIAQPVPGMMLYNTTTNQLEVFTNAWTRMLVYAETLKKLLGGSANEDCRGVLQTTDGGYIILSNTTSSNSGTLTGLTNNGGNDAWILKINSNGTIAWQKLLGGTNNDLGQEIRLLPDGNLIMVGYSLSSNSGTLTGLFNNGANDVWIVKLNATNGTTIWQTFYGGNFDDFAIDVGVTADGGFVVAASSTSTNLIEPNHGGDDNLIIKFNASNTVQWIKMLGGTHFDQPWSMDITPDNGIVVSATTTSSNSGNLAGLINNGLLDAWIYKLDENGNFIWNKIFGGNSDDYITNIEDSGTGDFYASGSTFSSNSGTLSELFNSGSWDLWAMKLDLSGNTVWQKLMGGNAFDDSYDAVVTTDGGYVIGGMTDSSNNGSFEGLFTNGGRDNIVIKLNNLGGVVWQKMYGGSSSDDVYSINKTSDGGVIVGASSLSSNSGSLLGLFTNGGKDCWLYKLDFSGTLH